LSRKHAAIALAGVALLAAAPPGPVGAAETRAQKFFSRELQSSSRAGPAVRRHLREGTWRIDRDIGFSDLTGDGKTDAVVRVYSGTAAQDVAVYVFSAEGSTKLRAVFAREGLYRVTVAIRNRALRVTVPSFAAGNPTCCPAAYLERTYRWRTDKFVLDGTRRIAARVPSPATG
jgi:hypothetical protein